MPANYFYPTSKNAIQKNLAAQLLSTATTGDAITFDDVDGIQNKPGVLVINRIDANNASTPSAREFISFTGTSGNTVLIDTRNVDGSGATRTHAIGSIVEFISDAVWAQRIIDQALVEHGTDGTHSVANMITGGSVLDEDDMSSNSATALATQQSIKSYVDVYGQNTSLARQAIINGNFDVSQRATTFVAGANNDDVYTLDRWNLFSDGNDVLDVSQEAITDLPGSNYAIKLDVETAKRAGIVQFIEAKDAQKFKGKSVSISFAVKSANISAIRATVLSWSSTADSITSDVVGTWGATPTWATNWADNATPADLTVTSSWTTVKVENIAIDEATVNNLALAIWLPNEETIGDIVYISQVQMNMGSVALPFQPKSFEEELRACQRYYQQYTSVAQYDQLGGFLGIAASTALAYIPVILPVTMRIKPVISFSTVANLSLADGITGVALTALAIINSSNPNFILQASVAAGLTQFRPYFLQAQVGAGQYIGYSAEL